MSQIFRLLAMALVALFLTACGTRAVQTRELLRDRSAFNERHEVPNVPFVEQSAGHCGPASLTMALQHAGFNLSIAEISPKVLTPAMNGSLQSDLVSAARRFGAMAVPIQGLRALLREIDADHPVIVFENLGLSWIPQWHYAVVYGYDLDSREVLMHSGPNASQRESMKVFEASWQLGDYWGLAVLPPGELAASADELANAQAAAALETLGHKQAAEKSYVAVLEKWPTSLVALVGLANLHYARGEVATAIQLLERATTAHPNSRIAQQNLRTAQAQLRRE